MRKIILLSLLVILLQATVVTYSEEDLSKELDTGRQVWLVYRSSNQTIMQKLETISKS